MWKMKLAAAALAVLAAAGCGTAAAAPAPPKQVVKMAPALPRMTHEQSVSDCAALDLVRTGGWKFAKEVQTVAVQLNVPQHVAAKVIAANVRANCPQETGVLP